MNPYRPPSAKPTAGSEKTGTGTEVLASGISRLWYFLIIAGLMLLVSAFAGLSAPVDAGGRPLPDPNGTRKAGLLSVIFLCVLGSTWATYRRLEHIGASRWWSLLTLVPGVNVLVAIICSIVPGKLRLTHPA